MQIDWARLLKTVKIEEAQVPVYYSLYFLNELLGIGPPQSVLTALKPDFFRRRLHEHFVPEKQVLSLQPMPDYPHFGFYFLPLIKRVLPDFIVMGRRKDKILYLLRVLYPPEAWLRYQYNLNGDTKIAEYYLRHPLKIMRHYLNEVLYVLTVSRRRHPIEQS